MNVEKRYTLTEAKLELAREECRQWGHDYEVFVPVGQDRPDAVVCDRCGKQWTVEK